MRVLHGQGVVRRIQPLVSYGEPRKPVIYALDKLGARILSEELGIDPATIDWKPKSHERHYPFLQHILDTTDIHIAIAQACARSTVQLETWITEQELRRQGTDPITITSPEGKSYTAAVVPDAVCVLRREERRSLLFLEVDKQTVTLAPSAWEKRGWARKVRAVLVYADTDAYRTRYEGRKVRVLTITTSEKRLSHMKEATEQAGGDDRLWFTTREALTPETFLAGAIWQRATRDGLFALLSA
jgi:hypothetical protein